MARRLFLMDGSDISSPRSSCENVISIFFLLSLLDYARSYRMGAELPMDFFFIDSSLLRPSIVSSLSNLVFPLIFENDFRSFSDVNSNEKKSPSKPCNSSFRLRDRDREKEKKLTRDRSVQEGTRPQTRHQSSIAGWKRQTH